MGGTTRRVVTGHDADGKSVILSDGPPPQHHPMQGPAIGADFGLGPAEAFHTLDTRGR